MELLLDEFADEKVLDLQAHRRAEELQAAKEQLDASGLTQQQPPFEVTSPELIQWRLCGLPSPAWNSHLLHPLMYRNPPHPLI